MKFTCERCSTRYSISDEKVQGKVLKIRCKTCGNIIVVREQGATSAQPEAAQMAAAGGGRAAPRTELDVGGGAPRPTAPSAGNVEWFVAIKGKQHGPMRHADVVNLYRQGKITARSYCWNEGLPEWIRLRELPDFQSVLGGAQPATPPPPPPADPAANVVDLQAARAQREQTDPALQAHNDPFAAVSGGAADTSGPPRESTRVFIMNAGLANRARKHRIYAAVAVASFLVIIGAMYADLKGYIEIPLLHSAVNKLAEAGIVEESTERKVKRKKAAIAEEMAEDEVMKQVCQLNPDADDCINWKAKKIAKLKKRRRRAKKNGEDDPLAGLDLDGAFGTGGAAGGAGKGINPASLTAEQLAALSGSDKDQAAKIRDMLKRGGKGPKGPKGPSAVTDKSGKKGASDEYPIDAKRIMKTFGQNKAAVEACVTQALKRGERTPKPAKQAVIVVISPNGRVSGARFKSAVVNASKLGGCITKVAKKMKFPPFAGEAFEVEWPLILSGG